MTGRGDDHFADVVLKELLDNSLDAAENVGAAPEVGVVTGHDLIAVRDNGDGIVPEKLADILDLYTATSDKERYRSPTRGAQGNAMRTLIGIPYASGSREPVVIESCGFRHVITARVDPDGEPRIEHDTEESVVDTGTRVEVPVPMDEQDFDPGYWLRAFAMFNPHVKFSHFDSIGNRAQNGHRETPKVYKPSDESLIKYRPDDPTSAHWYTEEALAALIFAHLGADEDMPLGEFVRQFQRLSSTAKRKAVRERVPGISRLSDYRDRREEIPTLLEAMQAESKAPSHAALGCVGEDHFKSSLERFHDVRDFKYNRKRGYLRSGLPFTFEIAVAVTEEPGELYTATNYSATFDDPLGNALLPGPKYAKRGAESFLSEGHASPRGYDPYKAAHTAVATHLITPAPVFMDKGKTHVNMEG